MMSEVTMKAVKEAKKLADKEAKEVKKIADKEDKEAKKLADKEAKEVKKIADKEAKEIAKKTANEEKEQKRINDNQNMTDSEWLCARHKNENKNKIEILPAEILKSLYQAFCSYITNFLNIERSLGQYIDRVTNFPSSISENFVLYILITINIQCYWNCKGDIMVNHNDENGFVQGEVKCCFHGPSQFSPDKKKEGHTLYYLDSTEHLEKKGYVKLYEIKNYINELKKVPINKKQLLEEQQDNGRRPRFSIKDVWPDLHPIWEGNIYDILDNFM